MTAAVFDLVPGDSPLVISMPHCGTDLSPGLADRLTPEALTLRDTDWFVPRLYDFAREFGATLISARYSRYVVDLNRPASGESLYPGQATTGLCPETLFDGRPLYRDGMAPDAAETAQRVETYWKPYHDALESALAAAQARHGYALLYDAHSIAARVPRLFDGVLPDLNLGTVKGVSVPPALRDRLGMVLDSAAEDGFTSVTDGRFIGGYITRAHGRPQENRLAIQMELSQETYMQEEGSGNSLRFTYREDRAVRIQAVLRRLLKVYTDWRP
ncbi:N-formylglutamate deformylase [Novispirillum itersonii]|uniref:N-formylglutamate deformylase n=1 Tax=Novispirillum itersonii TaxID=189 RepID=UPI0004757751|nr:N-formylglutamate deformylase [Novispirillum itersonii]